MAGVRFDELFKESCNSGEAAKTQAQGGMQLSVFVHVCEYLCISVHLRKHGGGFVNRGGMGGERGGREEREQQEIVSKRQQRICSMLVLTGGGRKSPAHRGERHRLQIRLGNGSRRFRRAMRVWRWATMQRCRVAGGLGSEGLTRTMDCISRRFLAISARIS